MSKESNIQRNFDCILRGSRGELVNNLLRQQAEQQQKILQLIQLFKENSRLEKEVRRLREDSQREELKCRVAQHYYNYPTQQDLEQLKVQTDGLQKDVRENEQLRRQYDAINRLINEYRRTQDQ